MDKFSIRPGTVPYGDFIEIKVLTETPHQWLSDARAALLYLLEGSKDNAITGAFEKRAAVLSFFAFLYPCPRQTELDFNTVPDPDQLGSVYFIPHGLVICLERGLDAEYLENLYSALLALFCFNADEPTPQVRQQFFTLFTAIHPKFADVASLQASKLPPSAET